MIQAPSRRQATKGDLDLIFEIVKASLGPYVVETWGTWDEAAQRLRFDEVTNPADHSLLEVDGSTIGCLCLKESEQEVRLVRLLFLPPFQGRGFGGAVMKEIVSAADEKRLPIRLRVLRVNPARRFYERLGFGVVDESETHYVMVRPPNSRLQPTAGSLRSPRGG